MKQGKIKLKIKLTIYQTASLIVLFSLAISTAIASAGNQTSPQTTSKEIQSFGKIKHFSIFGTSVTLNTLFGGTLSFQPNAWKILRDLGINAIRVGGGTEGDVAHFNVKKNPDEWAQNLQNFLALAQDNGVVVTFVTMGTIWDTLFGIVSPEPYKGINGTSVAESKSIIDKLAGDNKLQHNFIADPRIFAWSVANEVDLNNSITLNWSISILDYVRSKGGKALISSPYDSSLSSDWLASMDLHRIEPVLRDHVDFFEIHYYHVSVAAKAQQEGKSVYSEVYRDAYDSLSNYFLNGRGNMPIENLILGEFGIWHGYGEWESINFNFTDQSVSEYYQAVYQSAIDLGIRNIFNFILFSQITSNGDYVDKAQFWCVDIDGEYVFAKTSIMKKF